MDHEHDLRQLFKWTSRSGVIRLERCSLCSFVAEPSPAVPATESL
jgi:hypothetical protein